MERGAREEQGKEKEREGKRRGEGKERRGEEKKQLKKGRCGNLAPVTF